ncbi:MAG: hypothetical protein NW216_04205 [Hyphomicrobium sp.]|nr:hypothetical protein [Hyphomicrobium sp.]
MPVNTALAFPDFGGHEHETSITVTQFFCETISRMGTQVFKAAWSTQDGLDRRDVPQLFLPPEAEAVAGRTDGRWYLSYGFQQYVYHDPADPRQG